MTVDEAQDRRDITAFFGNSLNSFRSEGTNLPFLVPEICAEGHFTNKHDPEKNPLYFQAYRVPVLPRFPSQFLHEMLATDVRQASITLTEFSMYFGETLRILNDSDFAYISGHPGNASLIRTKDDSKLYITDLGTVQNFSKHPHARRFRGLDIYVFIGSFHRLLRHFEGLQVKGAPETGLDKNLLDRLHFAATYGLVYGYFSPELEDNQKKIRDYARIILDEFLEFQTSPQDFISSFDKTSLVSTTR